MQCRCILATMSYMVVKIFELPKVQKIVVVNFICDELLDTKLVNVLFPTFMSNLQLTCAG